MKYCYLTALSIVFFFVLSDVYSQKFTVGVLSGVNFANPKGEFTTGKWRSKSGPVNGLLINYSLSKFLSVETELNYLTQYYELLKYKNNPLYYYQSYRLTDLYAPYPVYADEVSSKWDINLIRIPVSVRFSTPTRLKFSFSAGLYWSFTDSYYFSGSRYSLYPIEYAYLSSRYIPYDIGTLPDKDFGYVFTSSLAYPVGEYFNLYVTGRYFTGRKEYFPSWEGKLRSYELNLGFSYSGIFNKKKNVVEYSPADSLAPQFYIRYKGGVSISSISGDDHNNSYSPRSSFNTGISLVYPAGKHFSFITELLYERKGYKMKGASGTYFRYTENKDYLNDNLIDLDYFVIPFLANLSIGNTWKIFLNTGPYVAFQLSSRVTGTAISEYSSAYSYSYRKIHVYDRIESEFASNDLGWVFGTGFEIPVCKVFAFELELRYNKGFKNILEESYFQAPTNDDVIRNNSIAVTAGIRIPIK